MPELQGLSGCIQILPSLAVKRRCPNTTSCLSLHSTLELTIALGHVGEEHRIKSPRIGLN
jgi:hypothetical protein